MSRPTRMHRISRTRFGASGLSITRVGLGAWAIGGGDWPGGWGPQDDEHSIATIRRALDRGIDWIDTAPAYGFGRAEEVVGRALARSSDRPLVFTKCGLVWPEGVRELSNSLAPASIRRECEASLRRLGVDAIDLLQAHWPTADGTPIGESWQTMAELVDAGKVRHIGLSNFTLDDLQTCERIRHVDSYQPELNLFARGVARDALEWCAAHGTAVIVYSPLRSGLLSGRFDATRAACLPDDDWRSRCDDFCEPRLSANLEAVARLTGLAARLDATLPELAIAWCLSWHGVTGAIVGARSPDQVDGWVRGGDLVLGVDELDEIAAILADTGVGDGPLNPARSHA